MAANPINITDTTLRDAHQSLLATRLRFEDMEAIAAKMDSIGLYSIEVWGGATFDVATRFLSEDPWERLRKFKKLIPNTPLMMLLRGQTLVGYRHYADDVVDAFVEQSARTGVDVFRVFDALNDERNLIRAARAVKDNQKHLQLAICYSVTENGRLGGPIYNIDYFINKAKIYQDMEADSICLKDMGGLMAPYDAFEIIQAVKSVVDVPIQLHTHYTSGMASMTVLKAIEAGVDIIDAALAPLALRTSQPAIEPIIVSLRDTERESHIELDRILAIGDQLEAVLPKYQEHMENPRSAVIDARVLSHQIPGGMASNLVSQLREADALDKLDEVLYEVPRTRKELGYPPLVTPMSQMVGTQSVSNVLFGRYKMVSDQVKDYAYGLYGSPVAPLDQTVLDIALKDYEGGTEPTSSRPADLIEPEMEMARDTIKDISADIQDVLTYALYPATGLKFLRVKYGLDPISEDVNKAKIANEPQVRLPTPNGSDELPPKSARARAYNVYVNEELFQVSVDPISGFGSSSVLGSERPPVAGQKATVRKTDAAASSVSKPESTSEVVIKAPIPGIVLRYLAEEGEDVHQGDPVVVLEAMKMENTLPSPVTGKITSVACQPGQTVAKDHVLVMIEPATNSS